MRYLVLVAALFVTVGLRAQTADSVSVLEPVLDGTHMDNMGVDYDPSWGSVELRMDSMSRVSLGELYEDVSEGVMGYRVGLLFDNSATARSRAQSAMSLCDSLYGDVVVTMSYANPYFKVSAGYCTTLEEALMLLKRMQRSFPSAFLTKEQIMPSHLVMVWDKEKAWADTLVYRREMSRLDRAVAVQADTAANAQTPSRVGATNIDAKVSD